MHDLTITKTRSQSFVSSTVLSCACAGWAVKAEEGTGLVDPVVGEASSQVGGLQYYSNGEQANLPYYPDYTYPPPSPPAAFSAPAHRCSPTHCPALLYSVQCLPSTDRLGLDSVLSAPMVLTAFVAAVFGGVLSPFISDGLNRMVEYEIQWPRIRRKVPQTGELSNSEKLYQNISTLAEDQARLLTVPWLEDTLERFQVKSSCFYNVRYN